MKMEFGNNFCPNILLFSVGTCYAPHVTHDISVLLNFTCSLTEDEQPPHTTIFLFLSLNIQQNIDQATV